MTRPNFLLIVADDLGYSDVGCFGGEIRTPNLDRLAAEGVRFSDYHTAPACSPTRSMIMSGTDNHLAGLGVMYEHRRQDPERWNRRGHEGYLNLDVAALPELLEDSGYRNLMVGKWHLGYREDFIPSSRGFHRSWALLPGCNNHFGWEPAWVNGDTGWDITGQLPRLYVEDGIKIMPETNRTNSPEGFYSSDFYVSRLIEYLDGEDKTKPFFAYLPFSAPHWPLQCYPEDRDAYRGVYDSGPAVLRSTRLQGLVKKGLINPDVTPHDVVAWTPEWEDMTTEERRMSARAMEVYAGMVTAMDRAIGRLIKHLEDTGQLGNTVIIFQSDNGAEEAHPVMGPDLMATIDKYYNNSYDNLGNHDSYIWYGPRWAQAATAPHRMMKTYVTEGGIRVPFIMRYPGFHLPPGSINRAFTTCMDILPTFLDLAKHQHPNPDPDPPTAMALYRNREVYGVRGKSWVPHLTTGSLDNIHGVYGMDGTVGWEQFGRVSLRQGKWKLVFIPTIHLTGTGEWQLYDLTQDQGETKDLATSSPDRLQEMIKLWEQHQEETGTVFGPPIKGGRNELLADQIGGDPVEDQKAWMRLDNGRALRSRSHV